MDKLIFSVTILLSIIIFNPGCKQINEKRIKNKLSLAIDLKDQENYSKALAEIKDALNIDSSYIELYIEKGQIENLSGAYNNALIDFSNAISIDSLNTLALFQKGISFAFIEKYDSAISYYNKSVLTKGSDTLYFEFNKNTPLKSALIDYDVDMTTIRYYRGMAYYLSQNLQKASSDFDFCLGEKYNLKGTYLYLALIQLKQNNLSEGCSFLKQAKLFGNQEAADYIVKYCQ